MAAASPPSPFAAGAADAPMIVVSVDLGYITYDSNWKFKLKFKRNVKKTK